MINGEKAFISGGGASDVYVVMARTGQQGMLRQGQRKRCLVNVVLCRRTKGHLVLRRREGHPRPFIRKEGKEGMVVKLFFNRRVTLTPVYMQLGWNSQPTRAVVFDKVRVPAASLVGKEGEVRYSFFGRPKALINRCRQGFRIAMKALDGGRINIGASQIQSVAQQTQLNGPFLCLKLLVVLVLLKPALSWRGTMFKYGRPLVLLCRPTRSVEDQNPRCGSFISDFLLDDSVQAS